MTQAEGYCNRANGKYDSAISPLRRAVPSEFKEDPGHNYFKKDLSCGSLRSWCYYRSRVHSWLC